MIGFHQTFIEKKHALEMADVNGILAEDSPLDSSAFGASSNDTVDKRTSLLDVIRDTLQRQGKVRERYILLNIIRPPCCIE